MEEANELPIGLVIIIGLVVDAICLPRDLASTCENPCACLMKSVLKARRAFPTKPPFQFLLLLTSLQKREKDKAGP